MRSSISLYAILLLFVIVAISSGCGNKRNPTGGPLDEVKPVVLGSTPVEFGQIENGIIEIAFSKPMDKSSLANSIYIYPPVTNKKVSLERSTLIIKIAEELRPDTNYFVTLSTRLKDTHGNALDKNQTITFRNGELNQFRMAGTIAYETPSDNGSPIELTVLSPDSILVKSERISGSTYSLEALNPQPHILRAYIDKDLNGRYDFGREPYFESTSDGAKIANLNMELAYADSTKPQIQRVSVISNRELQVSLSEPLKSYKAAIILGKQPLSIAHSLLEGDNITFLVAPMDSTEYTLQLLGAQDMKGNIANYLEKKFNGKAKADTLAPTITFTNPRNGASVNSLSPVLELHFNKIIPADRIMAKLFAGKEEIPLKLLSTTGRIHRFKPAKELENYRSHLLKVLTTTSDFNGNKMHKEYELQFLPLKRR
jgi:hypothetical protein